MGWDQAVKFDDFVASATGGAQPYGYQVALAASGLPDVLRAPTGSGKTLAAILPWLYRRIAHPDAQIRGETPHWLVVVLPQRTLVEQTVDAARRWVDRLRADVAVHVLMGGVDADDLQWKAHPERDRIFVGTQDMVLSRLLMRGFAEYRSGWPMSFGLLNAGVQFVFDEVQLMGPGLATSLQLQGLRERLGTALPCRTMWMSATIDAESLATVDFSRPLQVVDVSEEGGELARRMSATRTIRRLEIAGEAGKYAGKLAERVVAEHRPGTRTLVVINTVERAMEVHAKLLQQACGADVVLLHSRFRPGDRARQTQSALSAPCPGGTIVVTTQVLEAGVDVTSDLLVTEVAPWPSLVQRAGRCNRDGHARDARLLWVVPAGRTGHFPYEAADLEASASELAALEGQALTGRQLGERRVAVLPKISPVLRRRDLLDLFDTAPDLAGNDVDVSQFVRDAEDRTVSVAWRHLTDDDAPAVDRLELCPAPIGEVKEMIGADVRRGRLWDQVEGGWRPARREDVLPGAVIVFDAVKGGYLPERGFDRKSRFPVEPQVVEIETPDAFDLDPLSGNQGRWVSLAEHASETQAAAQRLLERFGPHLDLSVPQRDACVRAALLHDLGKAHPVFQASLLKANPDQPPPDGETVWAKSPGRRPLRHHPRHFRHELVTALWLRDNAIGLLDGDDEPELITYLTAAHHGKIRVTVRGRPDEPVGTLLGVEQGSRTLEVTLASRSIPSLVLSLLPTTHGVGSLTSASLRLRDRDDLGPFRLGFCEALVRAADWQTSAGVDAK